MVKACKKGKVGIELSEGPRQPAKEPNQELSAWERERDRLRNLWVVSVFFFWLSVVFQAGLYYWQDGRLNFILLSIIGGMMVFGVVLKIRYQRHLKKAT